MKIVVTDAYPLNQGDLEWDRITAFGELVIYDRTSKESIAEKCNEADIILTNKVPFAGDTFSKLPKLKLINVLATGYDIIDVASAKETGITVCNVPAYG